MQELDDDGTEAAASMPPPVIGQIFGFGGLSVLWGRIPNSETRHWTCSLQIHP